MKNPFSASGCRLGLILAVAALAGGVAGAHAQEKAAPAKAGDAAGVAKAAVAEAKAKLIKLAAIPAVPVPGEGWRPLFDGKTLTGWKFTDFAGHAETHCEAGLMVMEAGDPLTGVNWTNEAPTMNYEIALEAIKLDGSDFFCGLTFPVAKSWCSLILGGWGGGIVGLSSVDGQDASENETSQYMKIDKDHWYRIRVRVTPAKIEAWLDDQQIVNLVTKDRKISLRFGEIELSKPLGVAAYETRSALRAIQLRKL